MQNDIYKDLDAIKKCREAIKNDLEITPEVYAQMGTIIDRSPELVNTIGGHYEMMEKGEPIREKLGNEMQILYTRDRQTFTYLLFPELLEVGYKVGKIIGQKFIGPHLKGKSLPEIMKSNVPIAESHKYAIQELVTATEDFAVYRQYECADCHGMPNIGMKICCYEAGTVAGGVEVALGKRVEAVETKCCANGDDYCEFEVRVIEE